jgi:hypothetical protein
MHLDKQDNYNELSIIETTKDTIRALNELDAISLIKTILSSKLTYKEKYNDYDVYTDESNNKRYFKNGKENYHMFLENNGVNAIKYSDKQNKIGLNTKAYKIIASTIGFSLILSTVSFIPLADDTRFVDGTKYTLSNAIPLTSMEATNLIKNSLYLSVEEKDYLANQDYFDFVIKHTKSKEREYYLRNSLNNFRIKHFDTDFYPGVSGYYNPLDINAINILDTIDQTSPTYKDVITHEFVHATQDQNEYLYVIEATAEMLEYEFYNQPCDGYSDMVKRIKVLMEIIGPEPVISCIYNGDTTYFETSIKEYLSEEDALQLLELLKSDTADLYNTPDVMTSTNIKIDNLLSKMYTNKTGESINNDTMIRIIYATNTDKRFYFNAKSNYYVNGFYLISRKEDIDELDMNYVINSNDVEEYTYVVRITRNVGGDEMLCYSTETTNDISSVAPEDKQIVNILFKDGTRGICHYNVETDTWDSVEHFKMQDQYEPAIPKKFPDQVTTAYKEKEIPIKEECEAKLI